MIKPFLDAFEKELGHEKTYETVGEVIKKIALEQGAEYAKMLGANDMEALHSQEEAWTANDSLVLTNVVEGNTLYQTITRCSYCDMYERIGMKDLGYALSCIRDDYFYAGFNPEMEFSHTKTLMKGDDCCNCVFKFPAK